MPHKILVAEDNPDIQSLVCHVLEGDGYEVHVAGDGQAALDEYRALAPDLLVLDVMMPRLSGFEVLRELKDAGELRPETPVLALTSRSAESDVVTGFELGVSDYLTKPFMVSELRARVKTLLARRA
jgi:DNA-binding response OmpR family regulator